MIMRPTQENVRFLCHYDPDTGVFARIRKITWVGGIVECTPNPTKSTTHGYPQMNIFGRPYSIHRLIFLYMNGCFPKHEVDHINGDRLDNRWVNLREATRRVNMMNIGVRTDSTTGVTGVSKRKDTGKYVAYVDVVGERIRLGCFDTLTDAAEARVKASSLYGFHPNHGERAAWVG